MLSYIRTYTIDLVANTPYNFSVLGDFVNVHKSSSDFYFYTQDSDVKLHTGKTVNFGVIYTRVRLLSTVDQRIEIDLGFAKSVSGHGIPIETSETGNRGVAVYIQDQTTYPLDIIFLHQLGTSSLASNAVVDSRTITLSPGHGTVIGNVIELADNTNGSLFMQSTALNVVGDTITLDSPINYAYQTSTTSVLINNKNMAVNGSVTPVIFSIKPTAIQKGDINRVMCTIIDDANMDFSTFGAISGGLTNGVVLRINNGDGTYKHISNFKTNGDISNFAYDTDYFANIAISARGFSARATFNGQDKHGVVIRLDGSLSQSLEIVIQDDLTPLTSMRWLAQGSEIQGG